MAARGRFDVERSPRYRLAALARRWMAASERLYERRHGLSLSEWRILAFVGSEQPINAAAIADKGMLEKSHISRLVARLTSKGLIRAEPDTEDSRKSWLYTTDAGLAAWRDLSTLSLDADERFLAALSEAERAQLDALLTKLLASAPD